MKSSLIIIAGLALLIVTGSAEANWKTLDFPGAEWTELFGIDGENMVGSYVDTSDNVHGFLYDGANWTTLDFPGSHETYVFGIDGDKIIGCYATTSGTHFYHGFLYDGANWTTLDYPGAGATVLYGIDGDKIVGDYGDDIYTLGHGFLYDGANWTTLDFPGLSVNGAYGIDGENIVGTCFEPGEQHGFLYDGMNFTTLDSPGGEYTNPFDIDSNNIVGCLYTYPSTILRGFLYDGTNWTMLEAPGASETYAFGIDGEKIVGNYWKGSTMNGTMHGFIYTIPAPPIEAEVDIDPDTLNLNSKGKWITCYIWLPEEYDVADVNSQSVFLKDVIGADWVWADEQEQVMMAKFKRSDIQEMLTQSGELGEIELTVRCELMDGTLFEGMDIIRVIDKGKK